jgi:hypothetical protein
MDHAPTEQSKLREAFKSFALYMKPSQNLVQEAEGLMHAHLDNGVWEKALTDFASTLRFRYEMHQAFLSRE